MSFRLADFRHAVLGATAALIFALSASAVTAQEAKPATAASAAPAAASAPASAPAASAEVKPGDATAGQGKAAVCGACHGMDGNSADPQYPKLAGQHESYIARQLTSFKAGKRQNPIMLGMATPLSEQDMHDIGAYFASQTVRPGVADDAVVKQGETLYREGDPTRGIPACMACHLIDGRGNPGAIYPQLAGQHSQYVEATLKSWHDGTVWGTDAHAQIMPAIAKKLDAKDITALASYIEGLHPVDAGDTAATSAP
ncbi:c-type cytochrome [Dyella thiooxydans]|nr:c-type cytochrome [Dyella thiooxydans]